ncbi:MAG TPA: IPT/TIG domain-containing protein, partial [Chthonomonadaceae bacterium]|nr:IPT/TIG domain-containing protein [Chthonomonadaceae bacterium]
SGLPNARVIGLDYNPTTGVLAAGTHGRGMWVLGEASNPVPAISNISPASATAGGASFTLTVVGSKFVSSSTVNWNGTALMTTYVSASKLTASVPAAAIATAGTASVTVVNPAPGGGTSNVVSFTIHSSGTAPVLSSISPTSINAGGPGFTLIAKGSSFASNSSVNWNGTALTTTYVSATQLKASVPAADIASAGTAKITVSTPGAGTSASKSFTVLQTTVKLTLSALTRNSATGVITAKVTLKNTGHLAASNLSLTGSTLNGVGTTSSLPINGGNLAAGAAVVETLTYPGSAGTTGQSVTQKVWGTFIGGSFTGSLKVTLP